MLLLIPTYSFSQYEVSGIVKDSSDIFIEFANVVLTNLDNEIISGTITDGNGIFNLSVEEGEYRLIISFIGYQNWTKNITVSSDNDFGVITLIESKNELDEVLVTAKKPMIEQKVDRLVFNISENAFAKGKNALKALELAPMVWVSSKA